MSCIGALAHTERSQMYTRASASDYDDFQAKGWTTKELIPLMKKHETYQRSCNNRDLHGFEGPIKVSFGNYTCMYTRFNSLDIEPGR